MKPQSIKAERLYDRLIEALGPELYILSEAPLEDIANVSSAVAAAIGHMREGNVVREPGYDGVFGRIKLLDNPLAL